MEILVRIPVIGFFLLCVCITKSPKAAITFGNLPTGNNLGVAENTGTGTEIFKVVAVDSGALTVTYSMASSPATGDTYFDIDGGTGSITVISAIDYEAMPATTFVLTVTASAGGTNSLRDLTVDIIDKPEGLSFDQAGYSVTAAEGQSWGTFLPNIPFSVTDLDNGDTYTCTMLCPTPGDFTMVKSTCQVYFAKVYSLDSGDTSPVDCTVTATDSTGNTADTTLTITITEANNYFPQFSQASYNFYLSYYDAAGTTIADPGIIAATDYDTGTDGNVVYSIDQSTLPWPQDYFQIDSTTGKLTSTRQMSGSSCGCADSPLSFTVTATDGAGLTDTVPITVNVYTTTTTANSESTTRYLTFFDDPKSVAWFTICLFTALVVLVAAIYILYNYCCNYRGNYGRPGHRPRYQRHHDDEYRTQNNGRPSPIESNEKKWRQTRAYP